MFGLGPTELIVIGIIILLIFGAKRIPEIGRGLGGTVKELKNIKKELSGPDSENKNREKDVDKGEQEKDTGETRDDSPSFEARVGKKMMGHVPGVKKVMDINDKVKKVRDIVK